MEIKMSDDMMPNLDMISASINSIAEADKIASEDTGSKRGRPRGSKNKSKTNELTPLTGFFGVEGQAGTDESGRELTMPETNVPYSNIYNETEIMIRDTIHGIDGMAKQIQDDIAHIRESKTMKKKWDYIGVFAGVQGGLVGQRLSAIKEMNKMRADAANMDMKRYQAQQKAGLNQGTDPMENMTNMYNAFMQTPTGGVSNNQLFGMPGATEASAMAGSGLQTVHMDAQADADANQMYMLNPTESQLMMQQAANPNLEVVVVANEASGTTRFEILDNSTGQFVMGDKPDPMFLEGLNLNWVDMVATNTNTRQTYKIMKDNGSNPSLAMY